MTESTPTASATPAAGSRLAAIDAYRGLVMFLMMAEVLELARVAEAIPESGFWSFLAYHQTHVAWRGCALHDLIQPSFSFLVGTALAFSLARRRSRGEPVGRSIAHAAWRAFLLVALGVLLRSVGRSQTYFTFEDTLSQIGLGYLPLFLIALGPPRGRWIALVVILLGTWAAFVAYPAPGPDFNYAGVGVSPDWPHHAGGLAAHFNKNSNLAWAFDAWFLNRFPRESPFTHNGGGYATLSFIPTLATMILGLIAGGWLLAEGRPAVRLRNLAVAGVVCLALGYAADRTGLCPNVKRIWTPAWTLFSGGCCFLILAAFYATTDAIGRAGWSNPLRVIGRNSIAAYVIAHLCGAFIVDTLHTHLGHDIFRALGDAYEPLLTGAAVLAAYWLILYWMDRRRIYLRL